MRTLRLPIWTLMVVVAVVAASFAALRYPLELVASTFFTLAVGLLGVAVLVAVATSGRKRLAWLTFVIFGGLALMPVFIEPSIRPEPSNPPPLVTELLLGKIDFNLYYGNPDSLGPYSEMLHLRQIKQIAIALFVGFLASLMTLAVTAFKRTPETQ